MLFKNEEFKARGGIYRIVNVSTGKIYVGSAVNLNRRYLEHRKKLRNSKHSNIYLQNSWNAHGEDNFVFEILLVCDRDKVLIYEQIYLDFYESFKFENGFNMAPVAGNAAGVRHPPEGVERQKQKVRGRKRSQEELKACSESMKLLWASGHFKNRNYARKRKPYKKRIAVPEEKLYPRQNNEGF